MTNDDLISRAAAIAEIDEYIEEYSELEPETGYHSLKWCAMEEAKDVLSMLPAVDAAPVVHARWVKMTGMMPPEYHGHYMCSNCEWHMKGLRNSWTREEELSYCPGCGAIMGGGDADESK